MDIRLASQRHPGHPEQILNRAVSNVVKWIPPMLYAYLLASTFAIKTFTFGGSYLFEAPLALSIGFGLLARDPLARAAYRTVRYRRGHALALFLFITTLFVVGALVGQDVGYAYGDYRANLMVALAFLVGWEFRDRDPRPLIRFGIATGALAILSWYFQLASNDLETKFTSPYVCLIVAIVLACRIRRVVPALVALGMLIFLAAVSFYRQYWIGAGAGALILVGFMFARFDAAARVRTAAVLIAMAVVGVFALHSYAAKIESFFMDDQSRYIQSVGKTENLMSALGQGDNQMQQSDVVRMAYFQFMVEQPWKLALPHGLGYRSAFDNIDPFFNKLNFDVTTIDSLLFYLAYHYGLVVTVPLLAWLALSLLKCRAHDGTIAILGLAIVLGISLSFDGGQAVVIPRAIWLGIFVSCIAKPVRIRQARRR
ncbi:hypothetical protein [Trinickia dinghuensis]|uniref:O-antigen ligase domain-containing protein n=1 Tax=Trinickia dinghuensis TaxID=2291023 RepID=A0A3D8K2B1_9BURK|nr:hypothetical protein [Trinickia dinghuensis]RDU99597.1 hypothetical protein DWV00_08140 [Trinickia dinghuensis]